MTFRNISNKMLKSNYKRYLLYFWCNVFALALFYTFASLFTNDEFMNPAVVNSMISSNVYAPSVLTAVFMALFLNYSYGVFLKSRKSDYGVLMTVGMDDADVIKNIISESTLIHFISLACGLLVGTGLSFLFYEVIHYCIGISQISIKFNPKSYAVSILFYCVVTVVIVIYRIIQFAGMQIIDLLKERVNGEKSRNLHWLYILLGIIFITASVVVMFKRYNSDSDYLWFVSIFLMGIGLMLLLSNLKTIHNALKIRYLKWFNDQFLVKAFIKHHFKSYKTISFAAIWLIAFSVFFEGFSATTYPSLMKNAITYSPYDMVYGQIFGKNEVKDSDVKRILDEQHVTVTEEKQISYLRGQAFNLLSVSEVNKVFGSNYSVGDNEYITLYQIDLNDGYPHEKNMIIPDKINIDMKDKGLNLNCIGREIRILFNDNPATADYTLIISDNDYTRVKEKGNSYRPGIIKMFKFSDWRSSKNGVDSLQQYMTAANGIKNSELKYYKLTSKIETYNTAKQSSQLLLFMMSFVIILFCISADIMIHFKIKSEMEDEKKMLTGLFRIGLTDKECMELINKKNLYYYLAPIPIGCIIGSFYVFTITNTNRYGLTGVKYSLSISLLLMLFQIIIVKYYSINEMNNVGI